MQRIRYAGWIVIFYLVVGAANAEVHESDPETCLALNIYFESTGEPISGKIAVGLVTLNRVADRRWPNNICDVVWQPKQFSWTHDGKSDHPKDYPAWVDAKYAAGIAISLYTIKDSNHYHNLTVFPDWAQQDTHEDYIGYIKNHMFYNK